MTKSALITGASSGIGAAFARQLASQGFNLILVARREDRLIELAKEIQAKHSVGVTILTLDLAQPADVARAEQSIFECPDLELLVNNAGFGIPGKFSRSDIRKHQDMIAVHVVASVRLARAALPGMIARQRGAIINVSSVAAFVPAQGNPTYAATKAYLNAFSEALASELRGSGVKVQALCPGFTITGFHSTPEYQGKNIRAKIPNFLWMSADEVVKASLKTLNSDRVYCIPGYKYRLAAFLGRIGLASILANWLFRYVYKRD